MINHAGIPCEAVLIARLLPEASTYDPKCVVVIEKRLPLDRVFAVEQNRYILVTDGAELALRCAGHTEQTAVVAAGDMHCLAACAVQLGNWCLSISATSVLHSP